MQTQINTLLSLLENHLTKIPKQPLALAFSGGIDSTIIARLLKNLNYSITAYVVGTENCHDFKAGEKAAKELKIPLKKIILTEKQIEKGIELQVKILSNLYEKNREKIKPQTPKSKLNPVTVSSNIHLLFIEQNIKEEIIVTGLGADTVLGGFYKNLKMTKKEFDKNVKKETKILLEFDYLEDLETGKYFNKQVIMPFIHPDIADFCISLPYESKIKTVRERYKNSLVTSQELSKNKRAHRCNPKEDPSKKPLGVLDLGLKVNNINNINHTHNKKIRKYILRKAAEKLGISKELAFTEKKSAQYSSGIMKIMKKIAKNKELQLTEYIEKLRLSISKN